MTDSTATGSHVERDKQASAHPLPQWTLVLAVALLIGLALRAVILPLFVHDLLGYPVDYFFGEGDALVYTWRVIRGEAVYTNSSAYPMMGNIYPPVYLWISAFFAKFAAPTLASARAFATIPLGLTMATVGLFLKRARVWPALIAAGVLLIPCCYSMSHYLIVPRCDNWMAFFALASFYFLSSPELNRRDLILGGAFAALALFTKQTALPGLALIQLTLLIQQPRKGLIALASSAVCCAILLAVALAQFGQPMIEALTSLTSRRSLRLDQFWWGYLPALKSLCVIAAVAYGRAAWHVVSRWLPSAAPNSERKPWDLLDAYIVGHSIQTAFMLFMYSSSNYFLPVFPGMVIATVLLTDAWLKREFRGPSQRITRSVAVVCALLVLQLYVQIPFENNVTRPDADDVKQMQVAFDFMTGAQPVYAERCWGAIAERADADAYFVEPTHIFVLPPGRLAPETLEAPFKEKKFARVMLFKGSAYHSERLLNTIAENYTLAAKGYLKMCFGDVGYVEVLYFVRK